MIRLVLDFDVLHLYNDLLLVNSVAGRLLVLQIALGVRPALWLPVFFLLLVLIFDAIGGNFSVKLDWLVVLLRGICQEAFGFFLLGWVSVARSCLAYPWQLGQRNLSLHCTHFEVGLRRVGEEAKGFQVLAAIRVVCDNHELAIVVFHKVWHLATL